MADKKDRGWNLSESKATPESVFLNRRNLIIGGGVVAAGVDRRRLFPHARRHSRAARRSPAPEAPSVDPSRGLYPASRNDRYVVTRAITPEEINTTYNNFYEYGTSKSISREAEALVTRPWEIKIDGLVEKEITLGIDDLLKKVDRWRSASIATAASRRGRWWCRGPAFPLKTLVDMAKPLGSAKYLRMETFNDPDMARGQHASWYPWPYVEGLTMAEAVNDLAFVVTGAYGKPVAKSMGAPLRIHLPWKYGFKSAKSLVRFSFVEERPVNFWQEINSNEYGFWANVNPQVPHPRWSQAQERDIATDELIPTQLFNGYGEYVASMYSGLEDERLYA